MEVRTRPLVDVVEIEQAEKEGLVPDNRATEADRALVDVDPVSLSRCRNSSRRGACRDGLIPVVRPRIRIQRRVPETPNGTAAKPVCSRTCGVLDRTIAAAHFSVNRGQNQTDFTDQIGIDGRYRINSVGEAVVLNLNTIPDDRDVLCADAREGCVLTAEGICRARRIRWHNVLDACHYCDQVQHVVADDRQVLHLLLREHLTNRGARSRQHRVCGDADLNLRIDSGYYQIEVVPVGRVLTELNVGQVLGLKPGKRSAERIFSRKQI